MINVGSEIIVGGTILQEINVGVWINVGGNFYICIETWYFWSTLYFNIWHCTYQVLHTLFKAVKCSSSSSNSFWRWNFLTQIFNQNWENFIIQNVTNSFDWWLEVYYFNRVFIVNYREKGVFSISVYFAFTKQLLCICMERKQAGS